MDISIILAAGSGTRMKSDKSKVIHNILNRPLLWYAIEAGKNAGVEKNIVIIGRSSDDVKEYFKDDKSLTYVKQEIGENIPYGTGYAVSLAKEYINDDDNVLILLGDAPVITAKSLKDMIDFHKENDHDLTVMTAKKDNPFGYGRIVKDSNGKFLAIVEQKDLTKEQEYIDECNSGFYVFKGKALKESLGKISKNEKNGEYYLTDTIHILNQEGKKVETFLIKDSKEVSGVNSRAQLAFAEDIIRDRVNEHHMSKGVSIRGNSNVYIDIDVKIGRDTIIESGARIEGNTVIGEGCYITGDTKIVDSIIEDEVVIKSSYIEESYVSKNTTIGPFAHLRPKSNISENVHIGNFVEIKNSNIGKNCKMGHLAYIGDADLEGNNNIGCGVIFVNYDGKQKHRSVVEENAFIGSNSNIVAPVKIEKDAYVAAGSTIVEDVSKGDLAIARARQINKEKWVYKKAEKEDK